MYRKLAFASAVSLALLPDAAGALGLGGIRVQSALNEPFAGQIDLLDFPEGELDTIKISLAGEDEFAKANAARFHFLSRLDFRPVAASNGKVVIGVTSREPVREPYLDFLIEVVWPDGRLVKEYTVLLDPRVTSDRPSPPIARPAVRGRSRPPGRRVAAAPSPVPDVPASAAALRFPIIYGPVEQGAGLWKIASGMAPTTGASVSQAAMALYRNNTTAFIRGDIDRLMAGQLLAIPTAAELFALDTRAADQEFRAALRGEPVTSAPLTDVTAVSSPEDRLTIAGVPRSAAPDELSAEGPPQPAPTEPPRPAATSEPQVAEVPTRLAPAQDSAPREEPGASPRTESVLNALERDLLLVQETGETNRRETEELRGRIRELETQLVDIQRLLALSDERLSQLQQGGMGDSDAGGAQATDVPPPRVQDPPERAERAEGPLRVAVAGPEPMLAPPPVQEEAAADPIGALWETMRKPLVALGAGGVLLLSLLGLLVRRRRRNSPDALEAGDSELAPAVSVAAGSGPAPASTQGTAISPPPPMEDSDFGGGGGETADVDVVSEADVYITYGRYREAEKLLEEESDKSPERLDIKYKLAQAYQGARNLGGLEALMARMQEAGDDRVNPDQWQRLEDMLQNLRGTGVEGADLGAAGDGVWPSAGTGGPGSGYEPLVDASQAADLGREAPDQQVGDLALEVEDLQPIGDGPVAAAGDDASELEMATSELDLQLDELQEMKEGSLDLSAAPAPEPAPVPLDPGPTMAGESQARASEDLAAAQAQDDSASDFLASQWQSETGLWDEVTTKIDLARAYVEMEDAEAARGILEEVAEEGNESQRAQAREMIAQLR